MLRGDISNKRSLMFGFRYEDSLVHYRTDGIINKLANAVFGKNNRADINYDVLGLMKYLYWNTEFTVTIVIDDENYTTEAEEFISELPFNQVVNVRSLNEVTAMLNTGEMSYYIDECELSRGKVNNKYAMSLAEVNTLLKRHYGRLQNS